MTNLVNMTTNSKNSKVIMATSIRENVMSNVCELISNANIDKTLQNRDESQSKTSYNRNIRH